jgi:hypothetical protein
MLSKAENAFDEILEGGGRNSGPFDLVLIT